MIFEMDERKIWITAHAGCCGTKMDTLESIEMGISNGADIIEVDLNMDVNGGLILSHNKPSVGKIYPDLIDALKIIKDEAHILLNVDVKNMEVLEKSADIISKFELEDRMFYTGISQKTMIDCKDKLGDKKYFLNLEPTMELIRKICDENYLKALLSRFSVQNIVGINVNYQMVTKELVTVCKEKNYLCSVWTVDEAEDMRRMIALQVDNITTNQVKILKNEMFKENS